MIADLLLRPDNRLLGGATGDFSLFGGQPTPGLTFARSGGDTGQVSIATPVPTASHPTVSDTTPMTARPLAAPIDSIPAADSGGTSLQYAASTPPGITAAPESASPSVAGDLVPTALSGGSIVGGIVALGLADTIPTPATATADPVANPLAAAMGGFGAPTLDQVVPQIGAVTAQIAPLTEAVGELAEVVAEAATPITQAVGDTIVAPLADDIVAPVASDAAAIVEPVLAPIAAATTPIVDTVDGTVAPVTSAVAGVVAPPIAATADAVAAIEPVLAPVAETAAPVVDTAAEAVAPVTTAAADAAAPVVAAVAETVAPAGTTLAGAVEATAPIAAAIGPVVEPVVDGTAAVAPAIEAAAPVVDAAASAADTVAPVTAAAAPAVAPIVDAVQPAGAALQPPVEAVASVAAEAFGGSDPAGGVQTLVGMVANADAFDVIAPGATDPEPAPTVLDDLIGDVSEVAPLLGDHDDSDSDDDPGLLGGLG